MHIGAWNAIPCSCFVQPGISQLSVVITHARNIYSTSMRAFSKLTARSDRKAKKRDFRALWIQRINAGTREHGITYNQFISGLLKCNINLDRKVRLDSAH